MTFETWLLILFTCSLGAMSPGPSLLCVLQNALRGGATHGAVVSIAHASGVGVWALLTVTGISVISEKNSGLHHAVIVLGAGYLIYIGIRSVLAGFNTSPLTVTQKSVSLKRGAVDGFMIAFLNPKLAVFFIALFSQFVAPQQTLISSAAMIVTAAFVDALWYIFVSIIVSTSAIKDTLLDNMSLIDFVGGVVFVVVGVKVLFVNLV